MKNRGGALEAEAGGWLVQTQPGHWSDLERPCLSILKRARVQLSTKPHVRAPVVEKKRNSGAGAAALGALSRGHTRASEGATGDSPIVTPTIAELELRTPCKVRATQPRQEGYLQGTVQPILFLLMLQEPLSTLESVKAFAGFCTLRTLNL